MNQEHMQFIFEQASPRILLMKADEETTCEELFDPELWDSVSPSEHRYVFGRPISILVAQSKVPLEFAGFNRARHNLYRKK
jgi:hypothetical protein